MYHMDKVSCPKYLTNIGFSQINIVLSGSSFSCGTTKTIYAIMARFVTYFKYLVHKQQVLFLQLSYILAL